MKNARSSLVTFSLLGGLVVATSAAADSLTSAEPAITENKEQLQYQQLDSNGDGYISKAEAQAHPQLSSNFELVDQDQDHQLDHGEFARFEVADPEAAEAPR